MIGTCLSFLIRVELASPGTQILANDAQLYNTIITAHAFLMSTPFNFIILQEIKGWFLCIWQNVLGNGYILLIIISLEWYTPRVIGLFTPNKALSFIVDNKRFGIWGLPPVDPRLRGCFYVEVYESDTLRLDEKEPNILSNIYRYLLGIAVSDIISTSSILWAKSRSNEENKIVQTTKETIHDESMNIKKEDNKGTGDLTALFKNKRRRNHDSKKKPDLPKSKKKKEKDTNENKEKFDKSEKVLIKGGSSSILKDNSEISKLTVEEQLCRVVNDLLKNYKNINGLYNGIIRIIANPQFLFECYKFIKSNPGNMSTGLTNETLDGIDKEWYKRTAEELLKGKFRFRPARQVLIPKGDNNKVRPINVGNPREKIVQKAMQILISCIFEPEFLSVSHGFRPNKSVHSALDILHLKGGSYVWVIQGDIKECFDSIPHEIIMLRLKTKICCVRTLTLIERILKVGFVTQGKLGVKNKVGTPQGSGLSPLLANIVLHTFDEFMEGKIKGEYTLGKKAKANKKYTHYSNLRRYSRIDKVDPKIRINALKEMRKLPRYDAHDPNYKRVLYVRYGDDFVVLIKGSMKDAEAIRDKIKYYLQYNCGLELNMDKTVISNMREGFEFLGAYCIKRNNKSIFNKSNNQLNVSITRRSTLRLGVDVPIKKLIQKLIKYGFARHNKTGLLLAKGITHMIHQNHYAILQFFNSKIRGILNFYSFAGNRSSLHKIFWILRQSCALTLARKFKLRTMRKTFRKFGFDLKDPDSDVTLYIPKSLKRLSDFKIENSFDERKIDEILVKSWANKLTQSVKLGTCCICGSSTKVEMHHLRKVKDVRQKIRTGNITFAEWQGAVLRKQVPLCQYHHRLYHQGLLNYADLTHISRYSNNLK
jgi:group II intron reverse transcriptase/maturase